MRAMRSTLLTAVFLSTWLTLPVAATAAVTSNVRLALPDGRVLNDPVAVSLDPPFEFTAGSGTLRGAVDPRYTADLSQRWFEMAAGVSFTTVCGSACSAQTVSLGSYFITQEIRLTSPDRRPIEVTASWTTLASIDMPIDAWVNAQFKLGLLSGAFSPTPERNFWQQCWANGDSAAALARCPSPFAVRVPLDTPDTRSFTVRVSSGSVLQLEVAASLMASVPGSVGTSVYSGTLLLDPFMQITVPAGTIVETSAFPVTVVPEPHGAWLALAGLLGLARARRLARRAEAAGR